MNRNWTWVPLAALCAGSALAMPPRPPQLGLCAACHGENGIARVAGTPHLAAQDEQYLVDALQQYRSGKRDVAAMRAVSGALSVDDIRALARWYAAQNPHEARP